MLLWKIFAFWSSFLYLSYFPPRLRLRFPAVMFHIWLQRPLCPSFSVVCVFPRQKTGLMGLSATNTQSEQWQAVRSAVSPNYRRLTAETGGSRGPIAGSTRGTGDLLSDKLSAFNKSDNCLTLQKAWRFCHSGAATPVRLLVRCYSHSRCLELATKCRETKK